MVDKKAQAKDTGRGYHQRSFDPWDAFAAMAKTGISLPLLFTPQIMGWGSEMARIVTGRSDIKPCQGDNRFSHSDWVNDPLYKASMQAYLAWCEAVNRVTCQSLLGDHHKKQALDAVRLLTESLSPSLPAVNLDVGSRVFRARGASLIHGLSRMTDDILALTNNDSAKNATRLTLGKDVAATAGAVIYSCKQLELIQYKPVTPKVCCEPLLIIPSPINRYYLCDLYPHHSLVRYLLDAGIQVYTVSWRNPSCCHAKWALDAYLQSLLEVMAIIKSVSQCSDVNLFGYSAGGIFSALLASLLTASDHPAHVNSATFAVTSFYTQVKAQTGVPLDTRMTEAAKILSRMSGTLDGKELAELFAWLRPSNLFWNAWVCNYFAGEDQPTEDIAFWNNDTTRITSGLNCNFLDLCRENLLIEEDRMNICGYPVDLARITCDKYILAGSCDHLAPWEECYRSTLVMGKKRQFVLVNRGHARSVVCPEGARAARFYINSESDDNPEDWLAEAAQHAGSWWPHWVRWLQQRSLATKKAPTQMGNQDYPPALSAPGEYVLR